MGFLVARYPTTVKRISRIKYFLGSYMTAISVCVTIYFISEGDTTVINWIFFSLNILNLSFLSINDGKANTLKISLKIAKCIVIYSVVVMISECLFAWKFGMKDNMNKDSNNYWLMKEWPHFMKTFNSLVFVFTFLLAKTMIKRNS
jgi:hypothetical protein